MKKQQDPMRKFDFLIGKWFMKAEVPKSQFSDYATGEGKGEFKRVLNDRYVTFDYETSYPQGKASAHAVFVWDKKDKHYKYWWFEDSGEFNQAACDFIDENTLCLNWYNSLLVQTFQKDKNGNVTLEMRYPKDKDDYKVVLKVLFVKIN
jgi:hypothetical protein